MMHLPRLLSLLVWIAACALSLAGCGNHKRNAPDTSPPRLATKADHGTSAGPTYSSGSSASADYGGGADYSHDYAEAEASDSAIGTAPSSEPYTPRARERREARRAEHRDAVAQAHSPGLGTAYGEQHHSRVVSTPFRRDSGSPDVVLSMYYNDWDGIAAMGNAYGHRNSTSSSMTSADGAFTIALVDEMGRALPATDIDGRRYAAGDAGTRYQIRISNNSAFRFEVVTSVDGLDVIDGGEAGFHKRGYILDAWSSITIDGWRTSTESVAAFRFSDLEDSYAARTGRPRNIGVVGVAFFHEAGTAPWEELHRRHSSDPFPGFAPPPPPRSWR